MSAYVKTSLGTVKILSYGYDRNLDVIVLYSIGQETFGNSRIRRDRRGEMYFFVGNGEKVYISDIRKGEEK